MTIMINRGIKYTCSSPSCMTRFYDLNKLPVTCPKCRVEVPVVISKAAPRRTRRTARGRVPQLKVV